MRRIAALCAALALAAGGLVAGGLGAAPAFAATAPTVVRLAGPDAAATAAAVSAATFATGVGTAYIATRADFPDALSGGAAAGSKGPILFVDRDSVPSATTAELGRLKPGRIVVLGGPAAVSEAVATALDASTAGPVLRWAGADRYATAAAVSTATFATGVATAYIATGANFPDALAGGTAAAGKNPILLIHPDAIPADTATELTRLAPKRIVVLGGPAAVPEAIVSALDEFTTGTITRLAGADRYGTAAAIAATLPIAATGKVIVATGEAFTDALVAVPAAVKTTAPMVLVGSAGLASSTITELGRRGANTITVVGTEAAVSPDTVAALIAAAVPSLPAPHSGAGLAVDTAKAQLGKPYEWAGAGPDSFDCSGLTSFAWNAGGVTLPHQSKLQHDTTKAVPVTMVEPGDLVFYGSPIHHVGIYVGEGLMVEAANESVPVRTSTIWRSDLVGASRPGVS